MPEYYSLIRAAKYLGVAPWELERQHPKWYHRALACERGEIAGRTPATGGEPGAEES